MTYQPSPEISYPYLSDRVQAVFIDALLILLLSFGAASLLDRYEDAPDWIRAALFIGLWAIYEPVAVSLGATAGQWIKGLRVRAVSNTQKRINLFQSYLRYIIKVLLGWLSFLTIHSNKERRALHDLVSGSVVINIR